MERTLIKEVNKASINARLDSKKVKPILFPNFFSPKKVSTLNFESLYGEKGVAVMADVISYDAKAPLKTREIVKKISGEIPKIGIKRMMLESHVLKYQDLKYKTRDRADLQALLDLVFSDLDFCYNGVNARMEWLSLQALSQGSISLTKTNNAAGRVTEEAIDYQIPAANKSGFGSNASWANASSAKPLEDIEAVAETARQNGVPLRYVIMRNDTFKLLKNADDTKGKITTWVNNSAKLIININHINEYCIANGLPTIVVVDPAVQHESTKGSRTIVNPWAANRVALVPSLNVGSIQHAPIAAESSAEIRKIATLVKRGFTLITKWAEHEPYSEWTKAEANAFPVLDDPDSIYLLRTDNASW